MRGQGWQMPSPHPVLLKLLQVLEELQEPPPLLIAPYGKLGVCNYPKKQGQDIPRGQSHPQFANMF